MKSKFSFLLLATVTFICASCSDSDDGTAQNPIDGVWHMSNVKGGFILIDLDYNQGQVIWTFDASRKSLQIENNILTTGPEDIHAGRDSGSYSIEIQETDGVQKLFIEGLERGVLKVDGGVLSIDNGFFKDGYITTFGR